MSENWCGQNERNGDKEGDPNWVDQGERTGGRLPDKGGSLFWNFKRFVAWMNFSQDMSNVWVIKLGNCKYLVMSLVFLSSFGLE